LKISDERFDELSPDLLIPCFDWQLAESSANRLSGSVVHSCRFVLCPFTIRCDYREL